MGKKKKSAPQGADPQEQVQYMIDLSRETHARGQLGSAVFQAEEGLKIARQNLGYDSITTGHSMVQLAFLYIDSGKPGKAKVLLEQAGEIADQLNDLGLRARAMELLAECSLQDKNNLRKTTKFKNAQEFIRLAEEMKEKQARQAYESKASPAPQVTAPGPPKPGSEEHSSNQKRKHSSQAEVSAKRARAEPTAPANIYTLESEPTAVAECPGTPEEIEVGSLVPTDLADYHEVDTSSGWQRHRKDLKWLFHTASHVYYNTESTEYYRLEQGVAVLVKQDANGAQEQAKKQRGVVKYFVANKGYGFITPENGEADIIVKPPKGTEHRADDVVSRERCGTGQILEYNVGRVDGRDGAVDVVIIQDVAVVVEPAKPEHNHAAANNKTKPVQKPEHLPCNDREGIYRSIGPAAEWDGMLRAGEATLRGRQLHNEDRTSERSDGRLGQLGSFFGLYDGHGGHAAAEYCKKHMALALYKAYQETGAKSGTHGTPGFRKGGSLEGDSSGGGTCAVPETGEQAIAELDENFLKEAKAEGLRCGTTSVTCLVHGKGVKSGLDVTVANVGDSRIILCRGGKAVRLSNDHKPDRKDEKLRIERSGGTAMLVGGTWRVTKGCGWGTTKFNIPESQLLLATSRSLGDIELKNEDDLPNGPIISTPEMCTHAIGSEDMFVVLGSDGVWDHLTDQEVVDIGLRHFGKPKKAAEEICQGAFNNESEDNITALVVEFSWNGGRAAEFVQRVQAEKDSIAKKMSNVDMFASSDDD